MKAKDTVNSTFYCKPHDIDEYLMSQAEISFKAGVREVAEWVNQHLHRSPSCSYNFCFGERVWQAKLKEWGIDEKDTP